MTGRTDLLVQSGVGTPPAMVTDILEWLVSDPETFVILNHPFWDLAQAGGLRHEAILCRSSAAITRGSTRWFRASTSNLHGLV